MLEISKNRIKRRKAIAIVTAQVLFSIDPDVDLRGDVKEFAMILKDEKGLVWTFYGQTSGEEVAKLILEEGLDTDEVKRRILKYINRRNLSEKKRRYALINHLADYLCNYCSKTDTYKELVDDVKRAVTTIQMPTDVQLSISPENIPDLLETLTEDEKARLLHTLNRKIDRRDSDFKRGEELEKHINNFGKNYGIDCDMVEFISEGHDVFGIKVFIGNSEIFGWFNVTFNELKEALEKQVRLEAKDKVTCPFCGNKIIRYVAMNKLKKCDCGARIELADYSEKKENTTYMKKDIVFLKSPKEDD